MTPAASYLPPVPVVSVTDLPREQVRSLAHIYGHQRRQATCRFSALLPIVVRDEIYLDDGCTDPYEWAAKYGAMTCSEVDRVLSLWDRIGRFECLWRLLAEGGSMTKLERLAPHATEENAEWLAAQARRLTKPELEALLRTMRRGTASSLSALSADAPTRSALTAREAQGVQKPTPGLRASAPGAIPLGSTLQSSTRGASPSAGSRPEVETRALAGPAISSEGNALLGGDVSKVGEGPNPGEASNVVQGPNGGEASKVGEASNVGESRNPGVDPHLSDEPRRVSGALGVGDLPPEGGDTHTETCQDLGGGRYGLYGRAKDGDPGIRSEADAGETTDNADAESPAALTSTSKRLCRLSFEIDPIGEKRIRELQHMYERLYGRPIGLGDLVALLARWAIARGELPRLDHPEASFDCPASAILGTDATKDAAHAAVFDLALDGDRAPETDSALDARVPVSKVDPDRDEGDPLPAPDGRSSLPAIASSAASAEKVSEAGLSDWHRKRFLPRLLEVVVSIAEIGARFVRTSVGWMPVDDTALVGFLTRGQPVPLENLKIAAIASAANVTGKRHRPAAVNRYLLARSGGYCEVRGCTRRAAAAHHRRRFAFDPSHHPDDLICVCEVHHSLAHKGLIRDEAKAPGDWELLRVGEEPTLSGPDQKFRLYRT